MVDFAWDYPWSSVHAHLSGHDELGLIDIKKMSHYIDNWKSYSTEDFAKHERTGRPLGSDSFIEMAELLLNRDLKKKKPGPKVLSDDN